MEAAYFYYQNKHSLQISYGKYPRLRFKLIISRWVISEPFQNAVYIFDNQGVSDNKEIKAKDFFVSKWTLK